jgi:hypothetical protein
MKSALLALFVSALFWASTLYLVPGSSDFSLDHVTAMVSESTRFASETVDSFLSSAQANSYHGSIDPKKSSTPSGSAAKSNIHRTARTPRSAAKPSANNPR